MCRLNRGSVVRVTASPSPSSHADDVGFASMFVSEAESLATLAGIINRPEDAKKMKARAASQRGLIAKHLWDEHGGIFTNLFWNETFYRRISPTSFYAMMAGAPTDEQAAAMVTNWLLSPNHFCVAPNGDFKGNNDAWCVRPRPFLLLLPAAHPLAAMTQWLHAWSPFRGLFWGLIVTGPSAFCAVQNSYWGLPSIQHADPAFPALGYWRGYV